MPHHITLIGVGTIGVSFAALHLRYSDAVVSVYDPRTDLESHILSVLPGYLNSSSHESVLSVSDLLSQGHLLLTASLEEACKNATIVQEQGPESLVFKQNTWAAVEKYVTATTHLWTSTSGIPASQQNQTMTDKSRLLVVHPFNPPHIMPLLEVVPAPTTSPEEISFAKQYFDQLGAGHRVVVLQKEMPGFVGNRLAFIFLQEACYLVAEGVISAADLDTLVEASLGPRWAVTGPFKSYNAGGGARGIAGFLDNLSGTIQTVWDSAGRLNMTADQQSVSQGTGTTTSNWRRDVVGQTTSAFGMPTSADYAVRDQALQEVLQVQDRMKRWRAERPSD